MGKRDIENIDIAFFAATPYQIINAINVYISCFGGKSADLYIMDFAADISQLYLKVKENKIFNNVYHISDPWAKKGRIKFLSSYIFPKARIMDIVKYKKYNMMFGTRIGAANSFFYTHLKKNNGNLSFNYYDEGKGDYTVDIEPEEYLMSKIVYFLGYENAYKSIDNLWLYAPEIRANNFQYTVKHIPKIDDKVANLMTDIFAVEEQLRFPEDTKLIYLDQPFDRQQGIYIDDIGTLDLISTYIDKEKIYIKLHPSTSAEKYSKSGYKILKNTAVPWEVQISKCDREDVLFVAVNSTAAITPIVMFSKVRKTIFLYKYFTNLSTLDLAVENNYFKNLIKYYGKNNIAIPENEDELINTIKSIMK